MKAGVGDVGVTAGSWRKARVGAVGVLIAAAVDVQAAKVSDVTHLKGQRVNRLVGMGLVSGLKGTGDGGAFLPAIRPLASFLEQFSNPVAKFDELKDAKNVAIVAVEVTLPEFGVREGDRLDARVTSVGAAKSLLGGRLLSCPLQGPTKLDQFNYALASGAVVVDEPAVPTTGVVRQGAVLEANIIHNFIAAGRELDHQSAWIEPDADYVTLVLDDAHASYAMAHAIAQIINEDASEPGQLSVVAVAADAKNVIVRVPTVERDSPAGYIAHLESLPLFAPETEARVRINRKTSSIVVTGDVEILPVVVAHSGLSITTVAPPPGEPPPIGEAKPFVPLDTTRTGGTRLVDLLAALDQLKVPTRDQMEIIEELDKTGKLLGRLLIEE